MLKIQFFERQSFRKSRHENAMSNRSALGREAPEIILPPFTVEVWDHDQDLIHLRMHFDGECRQKWDKGMASFMEGDWETARVHLNHVSNRLDGNDGPSRYILNYIERYNFVSPSDRPGYRDLRSKNHDG